MTVVAETSKAPSTLPLWLVLIISETTLQLLLKVAGVSLGEPTLTRFWLNSVIHSPTALCASACYIGTFASWMLILKRSELSQAFPATAVTYVSVLLGSHWLFGEPVELFRYLGVALIVGGVSLLRD